MEALERLFNPRTIAVVGASNNPVKLGNIFTQRLAAGFRGKLYAINPNERQVAGITAHPSIGDVPGTIDLLIALLPGPLVADLADSCAPGKVVNLLAIPSGFGEIDGEGRRLQERLGAAARARGMRVVGPNCVGVVNGPAGLNASMMPAIPTGGRGLSCVTQSGGFGLALCMYAFDHGIAIAKFCDLGNMIDIQVSDMLRYLADDPDTAIVGLFLEAVGDQADFNRELARLAARKPVVFCPAGTTEAGRRASLAHIGIATETCPVPRTLPEGAMRARTGLQLFDIAKMILWQPRLRGRRLAIVTGTGGIGAELVDLAVEHGFEIPELSQALQRQLRAHLPYYAGVRNPVDLTPIWQDYATVYPRVLDALASSGEVDAAIVGVTDIAAAIPELAAALAAWPRRAGFPIACYWGGADRDREMMRLIETAGLPCYRSTMQVAAAMGAQLSHPGAAKA